MRCKGYEEWAVVATIDPDANGVGALNSDIIDMSKYSELMCIILAGELGAAATLDAKLQSDSDSGFGSGTDITGKSITQFTKAGTDDDKQAIIALREEELPAGERYVRLTATVGAATSDYGAVILGKTKYKPATAYDLASVDEIVD